MFNAICPDVYQQPRERTGGLRRQIVEIESEHMETLESRLERDDNRSKLRERLIGIQGLLESTYGAGTSAKVFGPHVDVIPRDAFALRRVATIAHDRLMDPAFTLPPAQLGGVEIEPRELAKGFEAPLAQLDQVLEELEDTLPNSNASLEEKTRALAELRLNAGIAAPPPGRHRIDSWLSLRFRLGEDARRAIARDRLRPCRRLKAALGLTCRSLRASEPANRRPRRRGSLESAADRHRALAPVATMVPATSVTVRHLGHGPATLGAPPRRVRHAVCASHLGQAASLHLFAA